MELLKLLSANELVSQVICFLILFFTLRVVLWKRVLGMLDARREKVASELKSIDDMKASVADIKADYEAKIAHIADEAKAKIDEAIGEGKMLGEEIRRKAEHDGEKILKNAQDNIKIELAKAKEDLKDTIVDLTISVAEKVIQERLSEPQDRKLVEDFIKEVERH